MTTPAYPADVLERAARIRLIGFDVDGTLTDGRLLGIFTDGDLRRALDQGLDVRQAPIAAIMSRNPRTVLAGRMATEAARLMEQHRINGLIVVDEAGRAVGALNIHDLLRARVV